MGIVYIVHIGGTKELGLLLQPVVELLGTHGQVPGSVTPVHLLAGVGQLARPVQGKEGVTDGAGVTAQVLQIGLGQHLGHSKRHAAHPQRQYRSVGDLLDYPLGNLDIHLGGLLVGAGGQRLVLPFHDVVGLRQVDPVRAVHPLEGGQMLIDLKNHRAGRLKDGTPGVVGDTQSAIALLIGLGHRHKGHVYPNVMAVKLGQIAQKHGHKGTQPPALELPLIVTDVPAVVVKGLLLRILLHHFNTRTDHQTAPDLYVGQLVPALRQGPVHQFGESAPKAVVYPVAAAHRQTGRLLGRHKFTFIVKKHGFPPSFSN